MVNNRPKSDCKDNSIYPWSCSQIESKCTIMTQPLICEHLTRSEGIVSFNRMHHRNNHLIYEAKGSPLTWFHSSLTCTRPILSWIAHSFWKMLWLPTAFTSCNYSCYFCCRFSILKKRVFFFHLPILTDSLVKHICKQNSKVLGQVDSWNNSCTVTESLGVQYYLQLLLVDCTEFREKMVSLHFFSSSLTNIFSSLLL